MNPTNNNQTVTTTYRADVDRQSFRNAETQLKRVQAEQLKSLQQSAKEQARVLASVKMTGQERDKALSKYESTLKKIKRIEDQRAKAQRDAIKNEKTKLQILEEQNTRIRNQAGSLGDVDTALSATRGGLSALSGGSQVAGLEEVAGLFELGEAVTQLRGAAPAAGQAIAQLAGSLGTGPLALVSVAVAATGALVVMSGQLSKTFADGNREIQNNIDAQQELQNLIASGASSTEVFERYTELLQDAETAGNNVAEVQERLNNLYSGTILNELVGELAGTGNLLRDEYNEVADAFSEAVQQSTVFREALENGTFAENDRQQAILDTAQRQQEQFQLEQRVNAFAQSATEETLNARLDAIETEKQAINSQVETLSAISTETTVAGDKARESIEALNKQLNTLNAEADMLNTTVADQVAQRERENREETSAGKVRERLAKARQQRERDAEQAEKDRIRSLEQVAKLNEQAAKATADYNRETAELIQDRLLRDQRELEDYNRETAQLNRDHQRELQDITKEGQATIAGINQSIADDRQQYFDDSQQAERDYQESIKKINRDYYKEDRRALQDALNDKLDAVQNNDVIAFQRAEREAERERKRRAEDRKDELKDMARQHAEENRERRRQFNAQQRLRQEELQLARRATAERLAESRRAFLEEMNQRREQRQLDLSRQRQDDMIEDQRRQQSLNLVLRGIQQKTQAELNGINQVIQAANQLGRNSRSYSSRNVPNTSRFGATPLGMKSYERNRISSSRLQVLSRGADPRMRFGNMRRTAFANEGLATQPTLALVGENLKNGEGEAMVKFRLSEGLPASIMRRSGRGGGAGQQLVFAPNVTVGDIATGAEVTSALQAYADELTQQIFNATSNAVNNPRS